MCGIVGFNWKDESLLKGLGDTLKHRGPDQSGAYHDDRVSLGHRRLSILDLSEHGKQPIANEAGNVIVVFNGEIFNFQELKKSLESKGHKFRSHTDSEVLVHLYEEYSYEMLNMLNGQFAFCIYDTERGELFLARDRVGILPLYYYDYDGKFIFSSELKPILHSGVPKEVDPKAVHFYLRFGFVGAPLCILKNAAKLKPAHYFVYDLKKKVISKFHRYWDITFTHVISDQEEAKKLIRESIHRSAKMRLMADVPVGAFLSGGIDSSIVVSALVDAKTKLKTFSVKFEYKDFDESNYAKEVSDHLGTDHHEILLRIKDIRSIIPELVEHYDEPFGDSSAIPTYFVSKFARQYVTVCLSGDGGDEILGGYDRYRFFFLFRKLNSLPWILKLLVRGMIKASLVFFPKFKLERAYEVMCFDKLGDIELYEKMVEKIDRKDLKKLLKLEVPFADSTEGIGTRTGLGCLEHHDIVNYLEGDILTKVDRAAMAVSLETRPPLLDHELIELCARISPSLKIKGFSGKWILKEAFNDKLPKTTIKRTKKGFGVPIKYYLKDELYDLVEKYVFNYVRHDYFDRDFLREMSFGRKPRDTYRLYWNIMMFNMWHERWIGKD